MSKIESGLMKDSLKKIWIPWNLIMNVYYEF